MTKPERQISAALAALIALQVIMLTALYAGVQPHPPTTTPLFGIAPFLGASISIAMAALILGPLNGADGKTLSAMAALLALLSFGPQKYLDFQIALIWPAVVLGQLSAIVIAFHVVRTEGEPRKHSQTERS